MDVIVLGFFNSEDAKLVEEVAIKNDLLVVWNYQQYNIDSEIGLKDMERYYKLYRTGILIDKNLPDEELFSSYSLIYEVSDYFMATEWNNETPRNPKLYNFFDALNESNLKKLIVTFADEWVENTTVKIESMNFGCVKSRLNSAYVWCFGYRNLAKNTESRDDFHPLVLELERN